MKQVIIFRSNSEEDIEETINSWITVNHKTNEILDIKLNSYQDNSYSTIHHFTAMIVYEGRSKQPNNKSRLD